MKPIELVYKITTRRVSQILSDVYNGVCVLKECTPERGQLHAFFISNAFFQLSLSVA